MKSGTLTVLQHFAKRRIVRKTVICGLDAKKVNTKTSTCRMERIFSLGYTALQPVLFSKHVCLNHYNGLYGFALHRSARAFGDLRQNPISDLRFVDSGKFHSDSRLSMSILKVKKSNSENTIGKTSPPEHPSLPRCRSTDWKSEQDFRASSQERHPRAALRKTDREIRNGALCESE